MANKKISELDAATTLQDADLVLISQDGAGFTSKKVVMSDFHKGILNPKVVELSNATSTISTDLTTGDIFKVHLNQAVTLANPTGGVNGKAYTWWLYQDGATRTVALGTKFSIPTSATSPLPFSAGGSKMDMLSARYDSVADKFYICAFVNGY